MNPRELDILNILYRTGEPMIVAEIVNSKHGLTQSTVTAVLRTLLQNGLVEVAGIGHSGKVLSRAYRPTMKAKQTILDYFTELWGLFRDVVTPQELIGEIIHSQYEKEEIK